MKLHVNKAHRTIILWALCVLLGGCLFHAPGKNLHETARTYGASDLWRQVSVKTELPIAVLLRDSAASNGHLRIYIEGDGRAWVRRTLPSNNPTPDNPLALKLALLDPAPAVAYIARPCQFASDLENTHCRTEHWTSGRFSPIVVNELNKVVSQLRVESGANEISLVGYSGGGAIAVLLAARRIDVEMLVTVAGLLDHETWTTVLNVSPLKGSLNPADELPGLAEIRQVHFIGDQDEVIPADISRRVVDKISAPGTQLITVREQGHSQGWENKWLGLLRDYVDERSPVGR